MSIDTSIFNHLKGTDTLATLRSLVESKREELGEDSLVEEFLEDNSNKFGIRTIQSARNILTGSNINRELSRIAGSDSLVESLVSLFKR